MRVFFTDRDDPLRRPTRPACWPKSLAACLVAVVVGTPSSGCSTVQLNRWAIWRPKPETPTPTADFLAAHSAALASEEQARRAIAEAETQLANEPYLLRLPQNLPEVSQREAAEPRQQPYVATVATVGADEGKSHTSWKEYPRKVGDGIVMGVQLAGAAVALATIWTVESVLGGDDDDPWDQSADRELTQWRKVRDQWVAEDKAKKRNVK